MNFQFLNVLILLIVFLVPLLEANKTFGFESIKVLFFILSITLIGFIWLFTKPQLKWDLIKIASLVFILILFITSSLGVDFRSSLFGKEPYFQGLILYAYLFLFSLLVSSATIKLEEIAVVLTGSAILVSFLAIKDWILLNIFNIPVLTYAGRVVSTFGQPNFYAGFLLLTLPFAYFLLKTSQGNRKLSYLGLISGLVSMIGILVSYSRSAILLALGLLVLGLTSELRIKFKLGLIVIFIFLASIFLALKFSSGMVGSEVSQPILTNNPDLTKESVEKRAYIWPQSFKIIVRKPLTGYGLENIGQSFSNYFDKNKHLLFEENLKISPVLISLKELTIDRSHNYILDLLLFSGVFGFLAWILLVGLLFWKLRKTKLHGRKILFVPLLIYLVWIQFQNQSVVHLIYFWLLVGLIDQGI